MRPDLAAMSPILDCMAEALAKLATRWPKRSPKAFYLGPDDWTDFIVSAEVHATVRVPFGNNPTVWRTELAFNGVPVRESKNVPPRQSRLYDDATIGHPIRPMPKRKADNGPADIPADQVLDALDRISRTRALTDHESLALEAALKGRVILSKRNAARLGIKRKAVHQ